MRSFVSVSRAQKAAPWSANRASCTGQTYTGSRLGRVKLSGSGKKIADLSADLA